MTHSLAPAALAVRDDGKEAARPGRHRLDPRRRAGWTLWCGCTGHHLAGRRVEHADPTDGLLDMTMINSASRSRLIRLFPTVFRGTHVDLDTVSTRRATTITVECPGISAYADGDFACTLPAEISVAREALRMLCPAGN